MEQMPNLTSMTHQTHQINEKKSKAFYWKCWNFLNQNICLRIKCAEIIYKLQLQVNTHRERVRKNVRWFSLLRPNKMWMVKALVVEISSLFSLNMNRHCNLLLCKMYTHSQTIHLSFIHLEFIGRAWIWRRCRRRRRQCFFFLYIKLKNKTNLTIKLFNKNTPTNGKATKWRFRRWTEFKCFNV